MITESYWHSTDKATTYDTSYLAEYTPHYTREVYSPQAPLLYRNNNSQSNEWNPIDWAEDKFNVRIQY